MRLTQLFLTCCLLVSTLVVAQEEASSAVSSVISKIPGGLIGGGLFDTIKIEKEFDLETKDVMINIGKVDIEIEKEIKKIPLNGVAAAEASVDSVEDAQQTNLLFPNKFELDKEIDIKKKDFIVNIGKVKIDIEKKKKVLIAGANAEDAEDAEDAEVAAIPQLINPNKLKIDKKIDIEKKDFIVNIGKVKVEIEKKKKVLPSWPWPAAQPITWKPTWKYPSIGATADENGQVYDDNTTIPLFEDFTPADEPDLSQEVVLGENATAITVQGGEKFDERGVLILTGPQIFSVTFKIVKEKVITMVGSDFNVAGYKKRKPKEAVTFIIRGRGFIPGGGLLFNEIDDVMGGTSKGGLFEFLEPRVFLGAIPLKVVKFTDTVIIARFLDFEDQRSFEPGTHLARVKVLHVDLKKEKKKHGPGGDIDILADHQDTTEIASVGGLVLPALGAIGGSITSGPALGVIGADNKKKNDVSQSLLGLFSGLRFDTAVLAVQFSVKDAEKIKGSYNTLYTDGYGLDI